MVDADASTTYAPPMAARRSIGRLCAGREYLPGTLQPRLRRLVVGACQSFAERS